MTAKATRESAPRTRSEGVPDPSDSIAPELRVVEWQNEWIVRSTFPSAWQSSDEVLSQLRERYRLDEVVHDGQTEFDQMRLLLEWVHTRWKHGWASTPSARNALEVLDAAEKGSDFNCSYYSLTLMQCLLALGYVARRFNISKAASDWRDPNEGNIGHSITEVWSHQFHKWVMLDADQNAHYEQGGIPLSVLEIHHAWTARRWYEVRVVQGPTAFRQTDQDPVGLWGVGQNEDERAAQTWIFTRHDAGDYYFDVGVYLGNTDHSSSDSLPVLRWIDEWTPPRIVNRNQAAADTWTGNEHDMYPTIDQVQINLDVDGEAWEQGRAELRVVLDHSMPNLDKLLVRLDEEPWHETKLDFAWKLRPGKNQIMAKGINAFGREGHTSRILLRYHAGAPARE